MKIHSNIPFFIPHSGCKNSCVFCSQVSITGKSRNQPGLHEELWELENTLESALKTISNGTEVQLAFFGGSFTGIEHERMTALLKTGYGYIKQGRISSIRVSTRPDYISRSILELLKAHGVTDIELGIQSISNRVLRASGRGHTAAASYESASLIRDCGFNLAGQMMIGLPLSTARDELDTADAIIEMGATSARIYPTVVFSGTALSDMVRNGTYIPLSEEDAVLHSALCLDKFVRAGVAVLKIGLHSSEGLAAAEYGANHPAIGELVKSRLYYLRLYEQLKEENCRGKAAVIYVKNGETSKLTGHGGGVINRLTREFGLKKIEVMTADVGLYSPVIKIKE